MEKSDLRALNGEWCQVKMKQQDAARRMMPRHDCGDGTWRFTDHHTGAEWFVAPADVEWALPEDEGLPRAEVIPAATADNCGAECGCGCCDVAARAIKAAERGDR